MLARLGQVICWAGCIALVGCATPPPPESYPGGIVSTREQAIALADKECGYGHIDSHGRSRARWKAKLNGEIWTVQADNGIYVEINAHDGKTVGCLLEVH